MQRNRFLLLTLLTAVAVCQPGQSQIFYDTVSIRPVGPGMMHYRIVAPALPWAINVLQVDLTNPYVTLETVKANDRLVGLEWTSSMASRKSGPGRLAVGAINGDFYGGGGIPSNIQISRGEILVRPIARPALGFNVRNVPMINNVTMAVTASLRDTVAVVHGVNTTRGTNQLILFNSYNGFTTGTNEFGTEALLRPVTGWIANDTIICVVESIQQGIGNMPIPKGRAVLSGHGTSESSVMSRLQSGDSLKLFQRISPGLAELKEMIGGSERIIHNGINVGAWPVRHPRTAVGFSRDSSTLFLVTVDGRQPSSVGMTLTEMGEFLLRLGIYQAINLDGGGSTTMVIRNSVMNSPSDGGERAVSNGLLVLSSAPTGSLSAVTISPKSTRVFRGQQRRFLAFGRDGYGNPSEIDPAFVRFSCDPQIGSIDSLSGVLTTVRSPAEGMVYLRYQSYLDSARVVVKPLGRILLSPTSVVTDTIRTISYSVDSHDVDGLRQTFPPDAYEWTLTNSTVGSISSTGAFKGAAEGTTGVVASLDGISDTAFVRVEIGKGYSLLDPLESLSGWTVSAVEVDSFSVTVVNSVSTAADSSFRIDYSFTGSPNISYIYLDKRFPVFGVPDSVIIDARTDQHRHRIFYVIEDDNREQFRLFSTRLLDRVGVLDTIRAPLSPNLVITQGAQLNFPIVIKRIEIQLVFRHQPGVRYSGTLFLNNLRVSYPQKLTTAIEFSPQSNPASFSLSQNYPNPFNPSTVIRFSIEKDGLTTLRVYDLIGREVTTLANEHLRAGAYTAKFDASHLPSGMYVYVLMSGGQRLAKKMVMLK